MTMEAEHFELIIDRISTIKPLLSHSDWAHL